MNDFNRRVLPDNDPLLRSQSLIAPSSRHHHNQTMTGGANDDGDSQSADYNDDNLINYDLEDNNFHGIESNFDESTMINESESIVDIELYKQQQPPHQQNSNIASKLSNNNALKNYQKPIDSQKRISTQGGKMTSSMKTNGFNNSKSFSQNTGFNKGQNQSQRVKQIKFSDEQHDELTLPGNHHVLNPTGYSYG
jgi:hypothetical protein